MEPAFRRGPSRPFLFPQRRPILARQRESRVNSAGLLLPRNRAGPQTGPNQREAGQLTLGQPAYCSQDGRISPSCQPSVWVYAGFDSSYNPSARMPPVTAWSPAVMMSAPIPLME